MSKCIAFPLKMPSLRFTIQTKNKTVTDNKQILRRVTGMRLFTLWRTQRCKSKCCPAPSTPITTYNYCRAHYLASYTNITHSTVYVIQAHSVQRSCCSQRIGSSRFETTNARSGDPNYIIQFTTHSAPASNSSQPRHNEMETFNPFRYTENFIITRHPQKKAELTFKEKWATWQENRMQL